VLTQPEGLTNDMLARVLSDGWGLTVASIGYLAVGFGSHHWEVVDADAVRWFVTADDLDLKQESAGEPDAAAFGRLRAALATALDLRDCGATFVIAPVPTRVGQPLALTSRRMGVALYPYVDGQSFSWGDFSTPAHRRGVLDLIVALHTAPAGPRRHAMAEDFAVPHRDELKLACDHIGTGWASGPSAQGHLRQMHKDPGGGAAPQRLYPLIGCMSERNQSRSTGPYQSTGTPRARCGSAPSLAYGSAPGGMPKTRFRSSRLLATGPPLRVAEPGMLSGQPSPACSPGSRARHVPRHMSTA